MLHFLLLVTVFAMSNLVHAAAAEQPQDSHQELTYDEARQKIVAVFSEYWNSSLQDKNNIATCTEIFKQYPKLLTESIMVNKDDTVGLLVKVLPLQAAVDEIYSRLSGLVPVEKEGTHPFLAPAERRLQDDMSCISFVETMVKLGADKNKFAGNGFSPLAIVNCIEQRFGEVPQAAALRKALRTPEDSPRAAQSESDEERE